MRLVYKLLITVGNWLLIGCSSWQGQSRKIFRAVSICPGKYQ